MDYASGTLPANSVCGQKTGSSESLMQVEACDSCDKSDCGAAALPAAGDKCAGDKVQEAGFSVANGPITMDDLAVLVDLFYMPFEHGPHAVQFLHTLHWLIDNIQAVQADNRNTDQVGSVLCFVVSLC